MDPSLIFTIVVSFIILVWLFYKISYEIGYKAGHEDTQTVWKHWLEQGMPMSARGTGNGGPGDVIENYTLDGVDVVLPDLKKVKK